MNEIHECDKINIDGHYAEVKIDKDGWAEVCAENSHGMDMFMQMKFSWCPFCGVKFPERPSEKPQESELRYGKDCICNNTHHGRCMDCGRQVY
jgi:hypothetical protein